MTSPRGSATIPRHSSPGSTVICSLHLTDTATGRPVTDLQTYLGAFGHTLIMSEDLNEYVHSHSLDIVPGGNDDEEMPQFLIPPGADLEKLRGGPNVIFEASCRSLALPRVDTVQTSRQSTRS